MERVVDSYDRLVNDPEIDVVYNPLPNGLHATGTYGRSGRASTC